MKSRMVAFPGMLLFAAVSLAQDAPKLERQSTADTPQPKTQAPKPATLEKAAPNPEAVKPKAKQERHEFTETEKRGYALGVQLGSDVVKRGLEVNPHQLVQGLMDALSGSKLLMTAEDINVTLAAIQKEQREKIALAVKELAEKNKNDGEAFLAANKAKEGVVSLPSGLQYKVLKVGNGKKPDVDDNVVCNYRGTLIDGTEIDSSYKRNEASTFPLKGVIKGWSEALQLMPVGSKWQLFVPPDLAYGERGTRNIPPNATLIFEVELFSIEKPNPAKAAAQPTSPAGAPGGPTAKTQNVPKVEHEPAK